MVVVVMLICCEVVRMYSIAVRMVFLLVVGQVLLLYMWRIGPFVGLFS